MVESLSNLPLDIFQKSCFDIHSSIYIFQFIAMPQILVEFANSAMWQSCRNTGFIGNVVKIVYFGKIYDLLAIASVPVDCYFPARDHTLKIESWEEP
ncbi:hypothetical protein ACS0TY_025043 [Phlomoides rotata]